MRLKITIGNQSESESDSMCVLFHCQVVAGLRDLARSQIETPQGQVPTSSLEACAVIERELRP